MKTEAVWQPALDAARAAIAGDAQLATLREQSRPPSAKGARWRPGLLTHLVGLALAVLLPALALGAVAVRELIDSHHTAFESRLTSTARALALALDEAIETHLAVARTLAASQSLASGDLARFEAEARAATAPMGSWVVLFGPGPEHRRLVNTAAPEGAPLRHGLALPPAEAPVPRVFATGSSLVTNVATGLNRGQPAALVLVPVWRGDRVAQVLGLGFDPERVRQLLLAQDTSEELMAIAADGAQRVVARSREHARFAGSPVTRTYAEAATSPEGIARGPSLDGTETVIAVARLRRADWTVGVAAPSELLDTARRFPARLLTEGGFVLLGLAGLLAVLLARRVLGSVLRLSAAASATAASASTSPLRLVPPAPVRELEVLRRALLRAEQAVAERTAAERRATEHQRLLTAELNHRVKNTLAVVQAALRLTPREDARRYATVVEGRIAALGRASALLADNNWQGAELEALLAAELASFRESHDGSLRVFLEGPRMDLALTTVQPLAMAFHELASNAAEHGALSQPGGRLVIRWTRRPDGRLQISWEETGGPPVRPPAREGFGSRVLHATLRQQLRGRLGLSWRPEGLLAEIELPAAALVQSQDQLAA